MPTAVKIQRPERISRAVPTTNSFHIVGSQTLCLLYGLYISAIPQVVVSIILIYDLFSLDTIERVALMLDDAVVIRSHLLDVLISREGDHSRLTESTVFGVLCFATTRTGVLNNSHVY